MKNLAKKAFAMLLAGAVLVSSITMNSTDAKASPLIGGTLNGYGSIKLNKLNGKDSYVHKTYTISPHKGDNTKVDVTAEIYWNTDPKYKNVDYVELALDNVEIDKSCNVSVVQTCTEQFVAKHPTYTQQELKVPGASCIRGRSFTYKRTAYTKGEKYSLNGDHYVVDDDMQHMYISMPLRSRDSFTLETYSAPTKEDYNYYINFYNSVGKAARGYLIFRTYTHNKLTIKFTVKKIANANTKALDVRTTVHHAWAASSTDRNAIVNNIGTLANVGVSISSGDFVSAFTGLSGLTSTKKVTIKKNESGCSDWARFKKTKLWS